MLLVTADQWRGDCLSLLGHPVVETPNIDAIAREGVAFANHYTVCAPCAPARASLLTGMYMHNHRVVRNGTPLEERHTNVAREARRAGYRPVLFGYTDTALDPGSYTAEEVLRHGYEGVMPGFEEGLHLPSEAPRAWLDYLAERGYRFENTEAAFTPEEGSPPGFGRARAAAPFSSPDSQTAFLTRRAIDYLSSADPGWFVHVSYFRPHPPFLAPPPWNLKYDASRVPRPARAATPDAEAALHPWTAAALGPHGDWPEAWMRDAIGRPDYDFEVDHLRATYYGLVSKVDHYIGELTGCLRERGVIDDTLIVITSDHGELLGDHYLFGKRGFYDSAFRIPLVIRDPCLPAEHRNRVVESFSESIDVMPTILEWIGAEAPRQCDGISLAPMCQGQIDVARDDVFWEYDFRNDSAGRGVEQELGLAADDCLLNVIRTRRGKYVHFSALPSLYFDLVDEPNETSNRLNDQSRREDVLEHAQRLISRRMRTDAPALAHLRVTRDGVHDFGAAPRH